MNNIIQPVRFLSNKEKRKYLKDEIPFENSVELGQVSVIKPVKFIDPVIFTEQPEYFLNSQYYDGYSGLGYAECCNNLYKKGSTHHLFTLEEVININNLDYIIERCRLGVNWKDSTIEYSLNKASNINEIMNSFYTKNLWLSDYFHTYLMERGKLRLICSLTFRDRVITKCINQYFVLPAFRNSLVYDNCASLKGKGINFAVNRLKVHMENASKRYNRYFYILKTDIKSYFDNISHEYLYNLITKHTKDERLLKFFKLYFKKAYYDKFIHNGEQVPYGIGLGSEISQSFGIICLSELDHIAQEKFGLKMVRYMDDTIYISNDKDKLKVFLEYSKSIISKMGLRYNMNKTCITDCYQGVVFLKQHYRLSKEVKNCVYIVPLKKGIKRAKKRFIKFHELMIEGEVDFDSVRLSYNSYRGHISSKGDTKILIEILDQLFDDLFINDPETYLDEVDKVRARTIKEEKEKNKQSKYNELNMFVRQSIELKNNIKYS